MKFKLLLYTALWVLIFGGAAVLCAIALSGCEDNERGYAKNAECVEFDRKTERAGRSVMCRFMWCTAEGYRSWTGAPMLLWCDGVDGGGK